MTNIVIAYNRMLKRLKEGKDSVKILNLGTKVRTSNKNKKTQSHFLRYLGK